MSTGSVVPFTPNQLTQSAVVTGTSQTLTFLPCDALLLYNSGSAVMFVTISNWSGTSTFAATLTGSMPVPAGAQMLLGVPGVVGPNSSEPLQLAVIGTAGTLYVTPGLGTQR